MNSDNFWWNNQQGYSKPQSDKAFKKDRNKQLWKWLKKNKPKVLKEFKDNNMGFEK